MLRRKLRTVDISIGDLEDYYTVRSEHDRPAKKKKRKPSQTNPDGPSTSYLAASSHGVQCASTSAAANVQLTRESQTGIDIPPSMPILILPGESLPIDPRTEESRTSSSSTGVDVPSNVATGSNSGTISSIASDGTLHDAESGNSNLPDVQVALYDADYSDTDVDFDPESSDDEPLQIQPNVQSDEAMEIVEEEGAAASAAPAPEEEQ